MDVTQKTVTAGTMLNGTTALKNDGTDITGNIVSKTSSDLTANVLTVTAPAGHYASAATKTLTDQYLLAENIKNGVSIFGVTGTYEGGGGGSNWTLLATQEYTVNTSSTTSTSVGDIEFPANVTLSYNDIIWVHVRDKAGKREGYHYGTDGFYLPYIWANNGAVQGSMSNKAFMNFICTSGNYSASTSSNYGVYGNQLYSNYVKISTRYNSSSTGTINGTYKVDVYKLTLPNGVTLFEVTA